jgi:hypothetical protein
VFPRIIEGDGYSLVIAKSRTMIGGVENLFGGSLPRVNLDVSVEQSGLTPIPPIYIFSERGSKQKKENCSQQEHKN